MNRRIIILMLLCSITIGLVACTKQTDVPVSLYIDSYKPAVTEYTGLGDTDGGIVYEDPVHFMYEDICFEKDNVISEGSYPFTGISAACYDLENKKIIYSKDIFTKVYPASTTKLLTALIAVRYLDLDDRILITEDNCGITTPGAQLCGFKAGDSLTVRDMLYCLLIYSGNDAAEAIALKVSGSDKEFAELMNSEAKAIGAIDTHFTNPHGLQDVNHYTTAYDIYLIFNECLKNEFLKQIFKTKDYYATITNKDGVENSIFMEPTNLYYAGKYTAPEGITVYGGKTGVTAAAGNCLIIYSEDESGNGFITEVFKAESKSVLYSEMNELLKMCLED